MESKNKTVAVNLARNVVHYMEKQNIFVMREFLNVNEDGKKFAVINWENCVANKDCVKPAADGKKDISTCSESTISDFPLFTSGVDDNGDSITDGRICYSVLAPEVNNFDYKDQIKVYIRDYYKGEDETKNQELINLLKTEKDNSKIEDEVKTKLNEVIGGLSGSDQYDSILKVYVVVNWHEKRDNIVLEGVISDEALR